MGISRFKLFRTLGITKGDEPQIETWTNKAFNRYEFEVWRDGRDSAPHGHPWHTSFHASAFPPRDGKACGRKALYTLMDFPGGEPTPRRLRGQGEVGKAIEYMVVHRWGRLGITIGGSVPLWDGAPMKQVGFEHPGLWLTGSSDAVLDIRPDWPAVLPVDVKSKAQDVIEQMRVGARSYDEAHYLQLQAYIFLCIHFHEEMGWSDLGLEPAKGGVIYYLSRNDPSQTHEFFIEADHELMRDASKYLESWKRSFLENSLPERPKSWRWTEDPCKWCQFKKNVCKPDYKAKVVRLSESHGVEFARTLRQEYDPHEIWKAVVDRWIPSSQEQS